MTTIPGWHKRNPGYDDDWLPRYLPYYSLELMSWVCDCWEFRAVKKCPHMHYRPKETVPVKEEYL